MIIFPVAELQPSPLITPTPCAATNRSSRKARPPVLTSEEAIELLDSIETARIVKRADGKEVEEPYLSGHAVPSPPASMTNRSTVQESHPEH